MRIFKLIITLQLKNYLVPSHISENGDKLILASSLKLQAIAYNWRDNTVGN
jgi:hypothetical protein